jgi:hypothetical protein
LNPDYSQYTRLLNTYVSTDGVRYAAWIQHAEDVARLQDFVVNLGQTDMDTLSMDARKALYINLYNAAMLQAVLDHYPIKSVKAIGLLPFAIFKRNFIPLGHDMVSLDDVEKGILLKRYSDPRIHFAVNCASQSCPPLRAEPFIASRLKAQLDEQTALFARSDRAARIYPGQRSIAYSELFNWYTDDFAGSHPAEFLNRYRKKKLPVDDSITWIHYDWSLNIAKH